MKFLNRLRHLPPFYLWTLLLALSAPFWSLAHPLIEVDDARYAEVPREMAATGHWATPELDYFDYVEKPPMGYWMSIVSYKIFGVNETAARLPLALLSILSVLGLLWTGSWMFDFETGFLAGIFLSSGLLYFLLSHYITPDFPLTAFLLGASSLILRTILHPEDARWSVPGAWIFSALAFLSKGLIGLVFPIGWVVLSAIFLPSFRKKSLLFLKGTGPFFFLAIVSPWFLVMERRHPGFFKFFFWDQHVLRFLTPKYNRQNPWYFFLIIFPTALLPWTPLALSGLWRGVSEFKKKETEAALAIWILMIIGFFSISHSKLVTYILPVIPQACLLAALEFKKPLPLWAKRLALSLSGIFLATALGGTLLNRFGKLQKYLPHSIPKTDVNVLSAAAVLILSAAALWSLTIQRAESQAISLETPSKIPSRLWHPLFCAWLIGLLGLSAFQFDSSALSAKNLCGFIKKFEKPGDLIYSDDIYLHGVPFYLARPVDRIINWTGELAYAKKLPGNSARFGNDSDIQKLPLPRKQVFIILPRSDAPHVFQLLNVHKMTGNRVFFSGPWACFDVY